MMMMMKLTNKPGGINQQTNELYSGHIYII
jgi:hypothetical protein